MQLSQQKRFFAVVLSIVVIVLILIGAYFSFNKKSQAPQTQDTNPELDLTTPAPNTTKAEVQKTSTQTPISTVNWRTFADSESGFSFRFPHTEGWTVIQNLEINQRPQKINVQISGPVQKDNIGNMDTFFGLKMGFDENGNKYLEDANFYSAEPNTMNLDPVKVAPTFLKNSREYQIAMKIYESFKMTQPDLVKTYSFGKYNFSYPLEWKLTAPEYIGGNDKVQFMETDPHAGQYQVSEYRIATFSCPMTDLTVSYSVPPTGSRVKTKTITYPDAVYTVDWWNYPATQNNSGFDTMTIARSGVVEPETTCTLTIDQRNRTATRTVLERVFSSVGVVH